MKLAEIASGAIIWAKRGMPFNFWLVFFFSFSSILTLMALFQSAIISDASGSVGGATFSKNKGGLYIRARIKGSQPNSQKQIQVRTNMTAVTQAWRELTDAQRLAWRDAAQSATYQSSLGQTKTLTGQNLFVKLNASAKAAEASAAIIETPPAPSAITATIASFDVVSNNGIAVFDIEGDITSNSNLRLSVFLAQNVSAGVESVKKSAFKKVLTVPASSTDPNAILTTPMNESQLSAIVGRKFWMYFLLTNVITGTTVTSNILPSTVISD